MRVALVLDAWEFPFNGAVTSSRRFAEALDGEGFKFSVLCAAGELAAPTPVEVLHLPALWVPGVNRVVQRMRFPLARPVRSTLRQAVDQADVVHVQVPLPLGMAAIGEARRQGVPLVCSFHLRPESLLLNLGLHSRTLTRWGYRAFTRHVYNRADLVIAPSAFAAGLLRRHGLQAPMRVISNGIPEAYFTTPAPRRAERFCVLCVGRFAAEKRQETLIRAVARCRGRERIGLRFLGVGPGDRGLRRLAERLEVGADFGSADSAGMIRHYREADLVVQTSAIELEPLVVLEAMAAAKTVVVSDSPEAATADLITGPETSFKAGDADDLAHRIDFWMEHETERVRQGLENQHRARGYAHARSAAALAAAYRDVKQRRGLDGTRRPEAESGGIAR